MLHQFRARADQRERSVLFVEPFHCRVVEMRELQLDDIAIRDAVVVPDLLSAAFVLATLALLSTFLFA